MLTETQEYRAALVSLERGGSVCFWTSTAAVDRLRAAGKLPAGVEVKRTEGDRALLAGAVRKDQPIASSSARATKETDMTDNEKKTTIALLKELRGEADEDQRKKIDAQLEALGEKTNDDDGDEDRQNVKGLDRATIEAIDRAMGLDGGQNDGIKRTSTTLVLGNMTREEARAHLAKLEGKR